MKHDYDTTLARIAGNIAAGLVQTGAQLEDVARESVTLAHLIVAKVQETERANVSVIELYAVAVAENAKLRAQLEDVVQELNATRGL